MISEVLEEEREEEERDGAGRCEDKKEGEKGRER